MARADRLIEVFNEAKKRLPGAERDDFLSKACENDALLKAQLVSLLQAHEAAGDFLQSGLFPPLTAVVTEKPGDRIGRYRLLQQLGEGGCGVVYMAEQEEPVRRCVALKVIKLGMDTRQVVARFEAERQALALMDHPNIASVFDTGATETGRPFFVMELVRGIRITDYCDQNNLATSERLDLFIRVCQAVQHAHQKGIIHRDIKPSNILVAQHDPDKIGMPKVIDFGIAKATTGQLTNKTLFTAFDQFIGTPAYMSPEQAEITGLDIDTRTDIYSLGVLLYELLTGKTPFDTKKLLAVGFDEMRRIIRETDPIKPSTRLTEERPATRLIDSGKSQIAARKSQIDRDLDWIVMKCLEKDRSRRYETADGLARDIQRHLNGEPVAARPPTRLYRLQKLVRRNKFTFAAVGVLIVALVMVAIGSTIAAWRVVAARRAERSQQLKAEAANRDLRDANFRLADTVSLLELERAEDLFRTRDAAAGLAHLAAILRRDPSNHIAASRLVSALVHRNWALPRAAPMRHPERVLTASFSPAGQQVLTACWDQSARVWNASSGRCLTIVHHENQITSAQYSPDGKWVVTASANGAAQIWDADTGQARSPALQHEGRVYWAEFSPDGKSVVTACADKVIRIWDTSTGALKRELRGHTWAVVLARFSPDGKRVASGTRQGGIRIWSVESGETLLRMPVSLARLNAVAFSPDGRRVVAAFFDGSAWLWDANTGAAIAEPLLPRNEYNPVWHAVFSPDSHFLLTTSDDGARIWDAEKGNPIGQPFLHDAGVVFGAFGPDGKTVVTTSMDNSARLWDVPSGAPLCQPLRQHERIVHADFSSDGRRLVTASYDLTAQIWDVQSRHSAGIEIEPAREITSLSFSPDGKALLTSSLDRQAHLWNARTGQPLGKPIRHQDSVYLAAFSPDGRRIVTASGSGAAHLWDTATGELVAGPLRHAAKLWSVRFNRRGDRLVTASADGTARIWDAGSGALIVTLSHRGEVYFAGFSLDTRYVVTASADRTGRVWDANTGQPVTDPLVHFDHVRWADFSPDGQRVATASTDNTACIWEVCTGKRIAPPLHHARTVEKVAFSLDGRRVVTGSLDRTARIWDANTGQAMTPPLWHNSVVTHVSFSADGKRILTAGWSGMLRIWDSNTGRPLSEWLDAGASNVSVCFDPTGERIASAARKVRIMDVPAAPVPVPEWFPAFAESVAGIRLSARGNIELLSQQQFDDLAKQVTVGDRSDFYYALAQWFLADPIHRPTAPF